MAAHNWIDLAQDADTGIETLRAHFEGHAYDPHWHDSYLIGVTEQGVQQFNCRRARHNSVPGQVFLVEPGELHDGDAPTADGFTYERAAITEWLRTKDTSPKTGATLESKALIPNHSLRSMIRAFNEAGSVPSTASPH